MQLFIYKKGFNYRNKLSYDRCVLCEFILNHSKFFLASNLNQKMPGNEEVIR